MEKLHHNSLRSLLTCLCDNEISQEDLRALRSYLDTLAEDESMIKEWTLNFFKTSVAMGILIMAVALLSPLFYQRYRAKMKIWIWLVIAVGLMIPFHFSPMNTPINITVGDAIVFEVPRSAPAAAQVEEPKQTEPGDTITSNDPGQNDTPELFPEDTPQQPAETPQQPTSSAPPTAEPSEALGAVWRKSMGFGYNLALDISFIK